LQSDTKNQKSLESLANMEDQHKRIFTEMRTTLTEKDKSPKVFVTPMTKYLSTLLQWRTTWAEKEAPLLLKSLTEKETLEEIPQTAVGLEKVSILFYPGIKDLIPSRSGQDRIDDIIKEERRHVIQLSNLLEKLKTN
jgi:rubrerythrin